MTDYCKKPTDYAPLGKTHDYLGHFKDPKHLNRGHNFSGKLLDKIRDTTDDIVLPVLDKLDRGAMTPEQRENARRTDPKFREVDDSFQERMRAHRRRKGEAK